MSEKVLRELKNLKAVLGSDATILGWYLANYDKDIRNIVEASDDIKRYLAEADVEEFLSHLRGISSRISYIDSHMESIIKANLPFERYQDLYLFLRDLSKHVSISKDVQDKMRRVVEKIKQLNVTYENIRNRYMHLRNQLDNIQKVYKDVDVFLIKYFLEHE